MTRIVSSFRTLVVSLGALACFANVACAEDLRYLIPGDPPQQVSKREQARILEALCDGTVKNGQCDACPHSSPVSSDGFSLRKVILGHFTGPRSTDAFVTAWGCEEMHASMSWGFLVTRRGDEWEAAGDVIGLDLDHCHAMRFRSGRDLLVCEDYGMESFELMHGVTAIFVKGGMITFRNLLTATDTTRLCDSQNRVETADIDKVEFRDLNGDGIEDVAFGASYGWMHDSKRRQAMCDAAQVGKPGAPGPGPKALKSYRVEYLFDGAQFKLTKESEAAAKLFERKE